MGLTESTLNPMIVKPLVSPDSKSPLPHFNLEAAKFTNRSSGFVITYIDIAKNTTISTHNIKMSYTLFGPIYIFICDDDTVISFFKDLDSKRVFCKVNRANSKTVIIRQCVSMYQPIESEEIDKLAKLYV
jgi:hypothetical protein